MRFKTVLFLLILSFAVNAQFRRIALVEEATNASCGPCAANNPNLQEFVEHNFGGAVTVRYHAWWPGTDPMYDHNPSENRARIQYYGINGVPAYTMDGVLKGVPGNAGTIQSQMEADIAQGSPIWININRIESSDSVKFDVQIIVGDNISGQLKLRNAIIERRITYAHPPGTNGEKIFNDVFRKMLPSTNGENLGNLTAGDTLNFSYGYPINSVWNADDLAVVSWVQDDNTKTVIQANIDFPTFYLKSDSPTAEIVSEGEQVTKNFNVYNSNPDTMHLIFNFSDDLPSGWAVSFALSDSNFTDDVVSILPNDSVTVTMNLTVGTTHGLGKATIFPQNADDPYLYGYASINYEFLPSGNVLLVDADGGTNYQTYFEVAFQNCNTEYSLLNRSVVSKLATELLNYDWGAIYWNTAWGFPAFVESEVAFLTNYLDNGGNLFIAGQDIGWDIFDGGGTSNFPDAAEFYHNYLGATYLADNAGNYSLSGVAGDPITDGLSFGVSSIHSRYPESIRPRGAGASTILKYGNGKIGAVKNETENYKTVYIGIGLEQVSTETARNALVENSLNWFGILNDVDDNSNGFPSVFKLEQNYPNPFNPSTNITYVIARSEATRQSAALPVQLKVYDALGREVATLVNKKQAPGKYSVQFNANNLPSGVYFYKLQAGDFVQTRKMMLLK